MKLSFSQQRRREGAVLLYCLIVALVLVIGTAAYFTLAQNEYTQVARSQNWNATLVVAEAGVADALAEINKYAATSTNVTEWADTAQADGWQALDDNVFYVERSLGSNFYDVYITNLTLGPVIKSVGTVPWNYGIACATRPVLAAVGISTGPGNTRRAVLITTAPGSYFLSGILVKKGVKLGGKGIVDSFDSASPLLSDDGAYTPSRRDDHGDITSLMSNVVDTTEITGGGGADVYGKVSVGPNSMVSLNGNTSVGSLDWVNGGNHGIQPGWSNNTANVAIPNAPPPPESSPLPLPTPDTNGNYVLDAFGGTTDYLLPSGFNLVNSEELLVTNGQVNLIATNFTATAQSSIVIATNAQLTAYLSGTINIEGQGIINVTNADGASFATNCTIYGEPDCTSFSYSGGSAFIGTIYAPEADVVLAGASDNVGAVVGNSFTLAGNGSFHYDENLGKITTGAAYRTVSWREVQP